MTPEEKVEAMHAALLNIMAFWERERTSVYDAGELMYQEAKEVLLKCFSKEPPT
jgi:hypothetical protein